MRIRLWRPSDDRRALKPPGVCHRAHTSTLAMAIKPRQMTFEILGAVWFPASARNQYRAGNLPRGNGRQYIIVEKRMEAPVSRAGRLFMIVQQIQRSFVGQRAPSSG